MKPVKLFGRSFGHSPVVKYRAHVFDEFKESAHLYEFFTVVNYKPYISDTPAFILPHYEFGDTVRLTTGLWSLRFSPSIFFGDQTKCKTFMFDREIGQYPGGIIGISHNCEHAGAIARLRHAGEFNVQDFVIDRSPLNQVLRWAAGTDVWGIL